MAIDSETEIDSSVDSLSDALARLKKNIDGINRSFVTPKEASSALGMLKEIEKSSPFIHARNILDIGTRLAFYHNTLRSVKDMDRSIALMHARPGIFETPQQALRFSSRMMELNNPEMLRRIEAIEKYGSEEAADIVAKSEEKERERRRKNEQAKERRDARKRFEYDTAPKFEREFHDLTERYGGGRSGERLAEEMMSRRSELRRSRARREFLQDTYRRLPWMKTLVDAGIIQKKELPRIAKTMMKMSKAPIIGHFVKHPMMIPLSAVGAAFAFMQKSDWANPIVQKWSASSEIYGDPSRRLDMAARLAGFGSKEAVNKLYAQLVGEYGERSADAVMAHIGAMLRSAKPGIQRDAILKAFKMDAQMGRAAMFMAGLAPLESDETAARISRLQDEIVRGFSSGSGFDATLRSMWLLIGGKWFESRFPELVETYRKGSEVAHRSGGRIDDLIRSLFRIEVHDEAEAAAGSLEAIESAGKPVSSVTNGGDTSVSFSIGNLEINANDAQALAEELIKVGSSRSGIDIMDAFDRREAV